MLKALHSAKQYQGERRQKLKIQRSLISSLLSVIVLSLSILVIHVNSSSVDRNTLVAKAKSCVGDHYVFAGHGNIYKNDYGEHEGIFWYDDGALKLWKFETTKAVWDKFKDSGWLERTGSGTPSDPYRYWDKCQGHGSGQQTSCDSATKKKHFDCVGLVYWVYKQSGYSWGTEPWTVGYLQSIDTDIELTNIQPGDLVYKGSSHVGMYVGFSGEDSIAEVVEAKGHLYGVIKSVFDGSWTSAGSLLVCTLTITATEGGTTNPSPGSYTYEAGTEVDVLATPDSNYSFDHWELDGANVGATNPYSFTMDQDHSLHAVFVYSPPGVPEFPEADISIVTATFTFLAALYFILKRKKQLPRLQA